MKNISKLGFMLLGLVFFVACEKDQDQAVLNSNAKVEATLSADKLVLESDKENESALTISWEEKDTQLNLVSSYFIRFRNGDKKVSISAGKSPAKLTVKQLNTVLIDLGLKAEKPADIQVEVVSKLSEYVEIVSKPQTINLTGYPGVPDLTTGWGIVGTFNNWGNDAPDTPFWKVIGKEYFVAYLHLTEDDREFKFRKDKDWQKGDYGSNADDGTLQAGGYHIGKTQKIKKGYYKITFNIEEKTYKIEPYTWSIIGSAVGDWNNNDKHLSYNGTKNVWEIKGVVFTDGEIKFRFNQNWQNPNYGDKDGDGKLDTEGGNNIKVSAGTYDVSVDFSANPPRYKIISK